MVDRVVKISLTAQVSSYIAGMEQATKATRDTTKTAAAAKAAFEEQNQAMTEVGRGLTAVGVTAAVGVGLAVKQFADFDQAISAVAAATHESAENMALLRDAALDAGARTVFTATEAANAIEELGKAGVSTQDILNGGLDGALDLAAAGNLGVAEAAGIAAVSLKTFKLQGSDAAHVADILAAGAGKAMGDVTDLSQALAQTGQVAASTGLSIDETTAGLAAFASQGLLGSDAGTSFKSMLQRLTPQSAEAAAKMDELGISAYDAQGNFIGLEQFAGNLQTSLAGLTVEQRNSALATIFGSDAVRAATVLYSEGRAGIGRWTDKVNDSGYAAETAATRLDNLKGDFEQLTGALDTGFIKTGSGANDVLRFLVQSGTDLVNVYNDAPEIVQTVALGLGIVTAGVTLTGGAFLLAVPKVAQFQLALSTLSTSQIPQFAAGASVMQAAVTKGSAAFASAARFMVGPWGIALAAGAVGVQLLTEYLDTLKSSSEEMEATVKGGGTALEQFRDQLDLTDLMADGGLKLAQQYLEGINDALKESGEISQQFGGDWLNSYTGINGDVVGLLKDVGTNLGNIAASDLPSAQAGFRELAAETDGSRERLWELLSVMPDYKEALIVQLKATGEYSDTMDDADKKQVLLTAAMGTAETQALAAADAYLKAADEVDGLETQLTNLIETIDKANQKGIDAVSANIDYQDSLRDLKAQIDEINAGTEGYAKTLDVATAAGSDNYNQLLDTAQAGKDAAAAQFELDHNTADYLVRLQSNRDTILQNAADLGATDEQLQYISEHIVAMPDQKAIDVIVDTLAAETALQTFLNSYKGVKIGVGIYANKSLPFNDGGTVPGGRSSVDNTMIWAASGEEIIRNGPAQKYRPLLKLINEDRLPAFRDGGTVGAPVQYAPSYMQGGSPVRVDSGPTYNETWQLVPDPRLPLAQQVFTASRRSRVRR
jgi:TP901 family phage tail tape measure protein